MREILCLISEILALEPSAREGSLESLNSILHRTMTILEHGFMISTKFKLKDHEPATHPVLLKQVQRYRFFLETLDDCCSCSQTEVGTVFFNKLGTINVVLGLFREEIEKDYWMRARSPSRFSISEILNNMIILPSGMTVSSFSIVNCFSGFYSWLRHLLIISVYLYFTYSPRREVIIRVRIQYTNKILFNHMLWVSIINFTINIILKWATTMLT